MSLLETLSQTLLIIENHKQDKLTIQDLSHKVYLSSSHLQRLFKLSTGQALMDYVRGRKLAHSLDEILQTNLRIIDIAHEYGFEHEQSYIRAFRKEYGCTPGEARETKRILPIRERISADILKSAGQGLLYGPEIVMVPSFHVVGKPHLFVQFDVYKDAAAPNQLGLNFFYNEVNHIPNAINPNVYIGLCSEFPGTNDVEYMPCVQVKNLSDIPNGLKGQTIPAHLSAKFRYVGEHHYEKLTMTAARSMYDSINSYFENQTRYVADWGLHFEMVDEKLCDNYLCQMDCLHCIEDTL